MEAASEARFMHDVLRKMLRTPVFLDSSALLDLRNLVTEGVRKSDTIVLLATKGVLSRPWCLLEVLEATREGIPIVMVQIATSGFVHDEARCFVAHLQEEMEALNPSGLALLHEQLGDDLSELTAACTVMLDANSGSPIVFDPNAGDNATVAMMKDVVERMAKDVGQRIKWRGANGLAPRTRLKKSTTRSNFARRCMMTAARKKLDPNSSRKPSATLEALTGSKKRLLSICKGAGWPFRESLASRRSSKGTGHSAEIHVANEKSALFVCCSRRDAVLHARVLRSELAVSLRRGCAVGGGADSVKFVEQSDAFVVLLTKRLPTDPDALLEIWTALEAGLTIITVAITGAYDFAAAAAAWADLPAAMEATRPGSSDELKARLPPDADVAATGRLIHSTLTAIIATSWSPHYGRNHMNAVVDDVVGRMVKRQRRLAGTRRPTLLKSSGLGAVDCSSTSCETSRPRVSKRSD